MIKIRLVCLLLAIALCACGKYIPKLDEVLPDKRTDYKKAKNLPDLEVPPDLTTDSIRDQMAIPEFDGETTTFSTYQERDAERKRREELERAQSAAIQIIDEEHIIAVEGATVQIWPALQAFWAGQGYAMDLDDEELGVIETSWNENPEELIRDRFKVFAEAGNELGTTVLYVSHQGEELVPQGDDLIWQPRERDIELERRVVEELLVHMSGGSSASAAGVDGSSIDHEVTQERPSRGAAVAPEGYTSDDYTGESDVNEDDFGEGFNRAHIISAGAGKVYLTIQEKFARAWKSIGKVLERVGVDVDQADRNRGIYYVRLDGEGASEKKSGVLSKLKFWGKDDKSLFQLSLTGVGEKTEVVVLDHEGKWHTSKAAGQLLNRLSRELNRNRI